MSPNSFWSRLSPKSPAPRPEALAQLAASKEQYNRTVERGHVVFRLSRWMDKRRIDNHFGDDLSITHVRRRHA